MSVLIHFIDLNYREVLVCLMLTVGLSQLYLIPVHAFIDRLSHTDYYKAEILALYVSVWLVAGVCAYSLSGLHHKSWTYAKIGYSQIQKLKEESREVKK